MTRQGRNQSLLLLLLCSALLLGGCGGKAGTAVPAAKFDQQWQGAMKPGLRAYQGGQYRLAGQLFSQALSRARQMDQSAAIATAAFNLAATRIQQGQLAAADAALQEAKQASLRSGADLNELLLLEAQLARWRGAADQAQRLASQLLHQLAPGEQRLRPQVRLLAGLLACEADNEQLAAGHLAEAAKSSAGKGPRLTASRAELQGCLALLRSQPEKAAEAFDRQATALRQAGQYRQLVGALHQAGRAYRAAGENFQAADRLYRAARSALSQQRLQLARQLTEEALPAARSANQPSLLNQLFQLQEELDEAEQRTSFQPDNRLASSKIPAAHASSRLIQV